MNKCLFDLQGKQCCAMDIDSNEKKSYCKICKAKCDEEYLLIKRYYDIMKAHGNESRNYARLKEELNSILGKKVTIVKLKVNQEKFNQLLLECALDRKRLSKATLLSYGTINNMANGGVTSLDSAKKVSDILGVKVVELFANTKM